MPAGETRRGERADAASIVDALSHPLRNDLFGALTGWLGSATIAELAEFTGAGVEDVGRHLVTLETCDLVEPLTDRDPATDPLAAYRATHDPLVDDGQWAEFPPVLRRQLMARLLEKFEQHLWGALSRGGFDGADVHVSWLPLDVDEQAYAEISKLLMETLERARAAQAASEQRRADGGLAGEETKSDIMLLHFRSDGPSEERPGEAVAGGMRERLFGLSDEIAREVPASVPDWTYIAARARALAALAERCGGDTAPD